MGKIQHFRRAKMEWLSVVPSGPTGALSMQKLQPTQFHTCACRLRTNVADPVPAVGATLAVARKPSPWGPTPLVKGRCREATEGIEKGGTAKP